MNAHLRVLVVEDSEDDTLLVLRELRRGGYDVELTQVETPEEMQAALDRQSWDVVIADYTLPTFSAPEALQVLQGHQPDLPFIIVVLQRSSFCRWNRSFSGEALHRRRSVKAHA